MQTKDRDACPHHGLYALPYGICELCRHAITYATSLKDSLGGNEFRRRVDRDQVSLECDGVGKAEVTSVDGRSVVRVVGKHYHTAFIFLDQDKVSPDSSHLKQLLARQHIDAGRTHPDGRQGRDVVMVWERRSEITDIVYSPKPSPTSFRWWKDYLTATYKRPISGDYVLAFVCVFLQTLLALGVSYAKTALDPSTAFSFAPAVVSSVFGLAIGIFTSTYRNWVFRGAKWKQTIKSSTVSFAFAYCLMISFGGVESLSFATAAGLMTHLFIMANVLANNIAKVEWNQIVLTRTMHRLNASMCNFSIRVFGKKLSTQINKASIENQLMYLVPFTLRLGDLTNITMDVFGFQIPQGKILLWSSIPQAIFLTKRYLRSLEEKKKREKKKKT